MRSFSEVNSEPHRNLVLFLPMLIVQAWLWLTVGIFAWGPWNWEVQNPLPTYGFLFLVHLLLAAGFWLGLQKPGAGYHGRYPAKHLLNLGLITAILIALPTSYQRTGHLIPNVLGGLLNPGAAYDTKLMVHLGETPWIEYLRFLAGPLLVLPLPLGVYYWNGLSGVQRAGVAVCTLLSISVSVATGTNRIIAEDLLVITVLTALSFSLKRSRISLGKTLAWLGSVVLGFCLFAYLFGSGMATRGGGNGSLVQGNLISAVDVRADFDHPWLRDQSSPVQTGVLGLTQYFSVGYQALSLSLEESWTPCFGVGNSPFLMRQVRRATGLDLWSRSYPGKLEARGWDALGTWSSIYPWLASDLSFPGVLVFALLIGWLFARVWKDVLVDENPFSIVLFTQLFLILFYIPSSNAVLQDGEGVSAFIALLVAWNVTRVVKNPSKGQYD